MAIKPLVDQIADAGSPFGQKNTFTGGCTTQDLLDTALAMRMKQTPAITAQTVGAVGRNVESYGA